MPSKVSASRPAPLLRRASPAVPKAPLYRIDFFKLNARSMVSKLRVQHHSTSAFFATFFQHGSALPPALQNFSSADVDGVQRPR